MLPDRVSNPGPLTYESDALPIALRGPASLKEKNLSLNFPQYPLLSGALIYYIGLKVMESHLI